MNHNANFFTSRLGICVVSSNVSSDNGDGVAPEVCNTY